MELTEQERMALEQEEAAAEKEPGETADVGEDEEQNEQQDQQEEGEPEGSEKQQEEGQEEPDIKVKTKDGKHEIPFEVLAALREENKQLRQLLEQTLAPKQEGSKEDRYVVDPVTGEKYVPFEKATEDELVAARGKFLQEGDYKTVNQIDILLQKKHLERATILASFEASKAEFASKNQWYGKDPVLTKMADDIMLHLDSDPQWRGKSFREGWEEVERRISPYVPVDKEALEKEILERVTQKLSATQESKPKDRVSLSGVGSSKPPIPPEDRWAELDALLQKDPARYERAVMRMSQQEYETYKRRMNRR